MQFSKTVYYIKKCVDLRAKKIATMVNRKKRLPEIYEVTFNAGNLSSGIYFIN